MSCPYAASRAFKAHGPQIGALAADARYFIDDILHQMKAIDVVWHAHVKRCGARFERIRFP
jgi:hypothetical protein